ncbi:MAG: LON peptidase substrate-binding domain-containing protein [Miltoncostaeaceae bacterium]
MPELDDLGLFPLGLVLLPGERAPLHLFEPRYRALLADCVLDDRPFVIMQAHGEGASAIGCTARFTGLGRRFADGRMNVSIIGERIVRLLEETSGRLYFTAWVEGVDDDSDVGSEERITEVHDLFQRLVNEIAPTAPPPPIREDIPLSYAVAGMIEMPVEPKQDLLECRDEDLRLGMVSAILSAALDGADRERIAAARARTNGKVALP